MHCINCLTPLGVNYLRCPKCGTKVTSAGAIAKHETRTIPGQAGHLEPAPAAKQNLQPVQSLPPLPPRRRALPIAVLALVLALLIGVAGLAANSLFGRVNSAVDAQFDGDWDRLAIQPAFEVKTFFSTRALKADDATYEVLSGSGKILYQGANNRPRIDEAKLYSRELIKVKVCLSVNKPLSFDTEPHCATTELIGSEKQVVALTRSIRFMGDTAPEQLQYSFVQERQRRIFPGTAGWSSVGEMSESVYLDAWVGNETSSKVRIRVPPSAALRGIELSGGEGFSAFSNAFFEAEKASHDIPVNVQFLFTEGDKLAPYPVIAQVVHTKSDEERLVELREFARKTAIQVVDDAYAGGNDVQARLLEWHFDRNQHRYTAAAQIEWRGKIFSANRYWIKGDIRAKEDGTEGQFTLTTEGDAIQALRNRVGAIAIGSAIAIKVFGGK